MALLPDHLDRLVDQQVGEHWIDLPLGKRDVESHHGGVALDMEGGDARPRSGEIERVAGNGRGASVLLGHGGAASTHDHCGDH